MALTKLKIRKRIKMRIRKNVSGTAERPRMTVFRSNRGIYVQLVDDLNANTLVAASSGKRDEKNSGNITKTEQAKKVGKLIAEKSLEKGISKVVFDRNGYLYHGRVKALADAAREGGLKF
ncbi:MAG: 50S ribosomal protein L18 [Bacteroidales bacterium]